MAPPRMGSFEEDYWRSVSLLRWFLPEKKISPCKISPWHTIGEGREQKKEIWKTVYFSRPCLCVIRLGCSQECLRLLQNANELKQWFFQDASSRRMPHSQCSCSSTLSPPPTSSAANLPTPGELVTVNTQKIHPSGSISSSFLQA